MKFKISYFSNQCVYMYANEQQVTRKRFTEYLNSENVLKDMKTSTTHTYIWPDYLELIILYTNIAAMHNIYAMFLFCKPRKPYSNWDVLKLK